MAVQKPVDIRAVTNEIVRRLNEDVRRIRNIETRMDRIDSSISTLEDTILGQLNDLKIDLEKLGNKINSLMDRLSGMENEIMRINKELGKTATKAELKQIESYVDILNPITSKFVTKDELERIMEERIKRLNLILKR
ncbi:MAG: hypothetical protein QMD12_03135 [Candidatus Aenigmarchaeota archaeon]|nr:hypothetical protein [Candidatus Aenigmarchaeota archaeon]